MRSKRFIRRRRRQQSRRFFFPKSSSRGGGGTEEQKYRTIEEIQKAVPIESVAAIRIGCRWLHHLTKVTELGQQAAATEEQLKEALPFEMEQLTQETRINSVFTSWSKGMMKLDPAKYKQEVIKQINRLERYIDRYRRAQFSLEEREHMQVVVSSEEGDDNKWTDLLFSKNTDFQVIRRYGETILTILSFLRQNAPIFNLQKTFASSFQEFGLFGDTISEFKRNDIPIYTWMNEYRMAEEFRDRFCVTECDVDQLHRSFAPFFLHSHIEKMVEYLERIYIETFDVSSSPTDKLIRCIETANNFQKLVVMTKTKTEKMIYEDGDFAQWFVKKIHESSKLEDWPIQFYQLFQEVFDEGSVSVQFACDQFRQLILYCRSLEQDRQYSRIFQSFADKEGLPSAASLHFLQAINSANYDENEEISDKAFASLLQFEELLRKQQEKTRIQKKIESLAPKLEDSCEFSSTGDRRKSRTINSMAHCAMKNLRKVFSTNRSTKDAH